MQTAEELASVLGGNAAINVLAYILAVCAVIATVGKALDVVQAWLRPGQKKSTDVQTCLKNDKSRLDDHDGRISALEKGLQKTQEGQRVTMEGVMALLEHELHNGNSQQMEDASRKIQAHLLSK